MSIIVKFLFFHTNVILGVYSDTKVWTHSTDYNNPDNWDAQRIPCSSDRVIFPENLGLTILLPVDVTMKELVLPRTGELLLPSTAELTVTGSSVIATDCPDPADNVFIRSGVPAWLDPGNWRNTGDYDNPAVPHLNRLPCAGDTAIFPAGTSFVLWLPDTPVYVNKIIVNDQELSNYEWTQFLLSDVGERTFLGDEDSRQYVVTVTDGDGCSDSSGCGCGTASTVEQMCALVQCPEFVPCYNPVRPAGHCCDMCGAYLLMDYKEEFKLQNLQKFVRDHMSHSMSSFIGKAAGTGMIQLVLIDKQGYSVDMKDYATELASAIEGEASLAVYRVEVYASGPPAVVSKLTRTMETMFGSFFFVVATVALIFLVFVYYGGGFPNFGALRAAAASSSFVFAKFENVVNDNEEGEEAEPSPGRRIRFQVDEQSQAFHNPMFGQQKEQQAVKPEEESSGKVAPQSFTFRKLKRRMSKGQEQVGEGERSSSESEDDADHSDNTVLIDVSITED